MIFHLEGAVRYIMPDSVSVDVNGVGYQVFMPQSMLAKVSHEGETFTFFTFHHIREDINQLYGFLTQSDRELFSVLTSISGIGPKVGIKMMSDVSPEDLKNAIITGDLVFLTSLPGIGKKTAERLIIELQDKLAKLYSLPTASSSGTSVTYKAPTSVQSDITMALKTLGYSSEEVKRALSQSGELISEETSLEDGIKILLKHL